MVSLRDSNSGHLPSSQTALSSSPARDTVKVHRTLGRSMRTVRSKIFSQSGAPPEQNFSETLTDSVIDFRLIELAVGDGGSHKSPVPEVTDFLELSQTFSDFSAYSSDISGELERLAKLPGTEESSHHGASDIESELGLGFLHRDNMTLEIFESGCLENHHPTVQICVKGLQSPCVTDQRSAAARLRLLAKNRPENREFIGSSGAIPALVPLLRSVDPCTQEHAVTALLNLSLDERNKELITDAGAIKPLVYALKTGTAASKQNAACALMNLSLIEENRLSIGACGAVPPLVAMLMGKSNRGKKDAMTTLYKLCGARQNKERAVRAGAVAPLVEMVGERGGGLSEKAMVVLSSLAAISAGREAVVAEGGIPALVEAIEDGSSKGKEFAVSTLLQLCGDSVTNRGLLVREGGIPPLVALSQSGTARAKHKAETLLKYLREHRQEASPSSP
ncbi:U-box domain-containing protein 4-like [Aristolochia californica]|uniref:U-box domain-containing protein 4-like n=1 Tax=Aristolochia californica TaxID=171875 RepID=UPI0035DA740F